MRELRVNRTVVALVVGAAFVLTAQAAYGVYLGSGVGGKSVTAVKMVGQGWATDDGGYTVSTTWEPMLGALDRTTPISVTMTIPAGHTALFRATLSGDAQCPYDDCLVRILVNGTPMEPIELSFGGPTMTASSAQFFTPKALKAGTYKVTAEWMVEATDQVLRMTTNLMTVDQIQVS